MSAPGTARRFALLLLLLAVAWSSPLMAQTANSVSTRNGSDAARLKVRLESDRLRISGPQIHFLTGRALERLHNGVSVTYALQLAIRGERSGHVLNAVSQNFSFSYDLWEEKFTVTRLDSPARSASNLSLERAEAWCLDSLSLPLAALPHERPFWIGLEFATVEEKDPNPAGGSTLTLSSLIDIFSRKPRDEQQVRGVEEVGPLSLSDLMRKK